MVLTFNFICLNIIKTQCAIAWIILQQRSGYAFLKYFFHSEYFTKKENHLCRLITQDKYETSMRRSLNKHEKTWKKRA